MAGSARISLIVSEGIILNGTNVYITGAAGFRNALYPPVPKFNTIEEANEWLEANRP